MRKGRDRGNGEKNGEEKKEKTDENSGHYVIASSWLPKRQLLERHSLVPKLVIWFHPMPGDYYKTMFVLQGVQKIFEPLMAKVIL